MKLLIGKKLFESGIIRVCFNNKEVIFVDYDSSKIDLQLELDTLGYKYEVLGYSKDNEVHIGIMVDIEKVCIMVGDEDKISNKLYSFMYTTCVYESAYFTMSLHKTKREAFKAMNKYLNDTWYKNYYDYLNHGKGFNRKINIKYPSLKSYFKVGEGEGWYVGEQNVE